VWLEFGKVDLDELIVFGALVLAKFGGVGASEVADILTLGGLSRSQNDVIRVRWK